MKQMKEEERNKILRWKYLEAAATTGLISH